MRFGENNVLCPKYIDIYDFWGVWGGVGGRTYSTIHFLFIIKKTEKDLYLNHYSTSFGFKKIS